MTTTYLRDVVEPVLFFKAVDEGWIKVREHPTHPNLRIANYTDVTAFSRHWTPETLAARGLIFDIETHEVLARPFSKFFNHGEPGAREIGLQDTVKVFNKADGSLGIVYRTDDGFLHVATRGSFTSEQAIWATNWLDKAADETYEMLDRLITMGMTPLVEIVYPGNRIVLDYYGFEGLISLGSVQMSTGIVGHPFSTPDIHPTKFFGEMTLAEALARPPRKNAEGFVLHAGPRASDFVKVKQADYLRAHKIVTGLSVKEVWRQMQAGTFDDYVVLLPDEFQEWALEKYDDLAASFNHIMGEVVVGFQGVMKAHLEGPRKAQALWIQENVPAIYRGLVFSMLDGKPLSPGIYKMIEPKGKQPLIPDEA